MSSESSNSSSSYTGITDIVNFFVNLYTGEDYRVINSFNNEEQIDLNGVIAVSAGNIEHLNHGDCNDYRITITISGQFNIAQDVNQSKTYKMLEYIISKLDIDTIKAGFFDLAGAVKIGGGVSSDGQVNNCNYSIDLYFCKD